MMCHISSSNVGLKKCPTLVGNGDNGGSYLSMGVEDLWEISVPTPRFCSEPKIALKNKSIYHKKSTLGIFI